MNSEYKSISYHDLKNKIVFLTGSNGDFGKELLKRFSEEGSLIIAHCRETNPIFDDYITDLMSKYNVKIHCFEHDLRNNLELVTLKTFLDSIKVSKIDILINNAGVFNNSLIEMSTNATIEEIFEINFLAQIRLTKALVKFMRKSDQASIINITSKSSIDLNVGEGIYGVSKLALNGLTKVLSRELSINKIRVNAVAPGLMDTIWAENIGLKASTEYIKQSSLGRLLKLSEVANVILFLSSKASIAINGQVVLCDGG